MSITIEIKRTAGTEPEDQLADLATEHAQLKKMLDRVEQSMQREYDRLQYKKMGKSY